MFKNVVYNIVERHSKIVNLKLLLNVPQIKLSGNTKPWTDSMRQVMKNF